MAVSKKKEVSLAPYLLVALNVIFAVIAVAGQVGQNVSLPLWSGATSSLTDPNCTTTTSLSTEESDYNSLTSGNTTGNQSSSDHIMDPFFVLSFASLSFVVIFGITTAVMAVVQWITNAVKGRRVLNWLTLQDDLFFPQWQLLLIGVFDALNGVFVVFASMPARTAPFLQAILGNFTIPMTIFFRLIILRKRPTLLKLLAAIAVLVGLLISLVPVISGLDADSKKSNKDYLSQSRLSQILWPLCFIFGFIPAAVMNVIEEMSLKSTRKVNLFYLLFCTSTYQLITVWLLFWVDIIPHFGFATSVKDFGENYKFAFQCFFGGADCGYKPGAAGSAFIILYVVSYIGGGMLLRYSEGATYLAIVQSLVTPLGALFWSIFSDDECGHVFLDPHGDSLTYFAIGGMVIMVPAIFLYNIGTFEGLKNLVRCRKDKGYKVINETTPLMKSPPSINP